MASTLPATVRLDTSLAEETLVVEADAVRSTLAAALDTTDPADVTLELTPTIVAPHGQNMPLPKRGPARSTSDGRPSQSSIVASTNSPRSRSPQLAGS